jgi:hypothetical protein
MAAFKLNSVVIRSLIEQRFGGSISRLAEALSLDPPPNRSTVARWLSSDGRLFPRDQDRILALAGALDVDPLALWTFDEENYPTLWPKIIRASQTGHWSGLLKPLAFLQSFMESEDEWPAQSLARRYFDRSWYHQEVQHDPLIQANYYQNLIIQPRALDSALPAVWHVAWRHPLPRARWQPAGFVRRDPAQVTLFNGWAITDSAAAAPDDPNLCVETWFGRCPATFRVASLHPFVLTTANTPAPGVPQVRFAMPAEPAPRQQTAPTCAQRAAGS